jgi:hypothetical protein
MAFEPFLAYELVNDQQAERLYNVMREYRETVNDFIEDEEGPDREKAQKVMEAIAEMDDAYKEIADEIYRVPATVHIAAEKGEESNPDNPEQTAVVQRCARCGSILQFWFDGIMYLALDGSVRDFEEEDSEWWEVGEQVGKTDATGGIDIYPVDEDHELESWETECADLSELEAMLDGET